MGHATTVDGARLAGRIRRERDSLVRHLPGAREGDGRGVHQARVASRRLRELLPIAEAAVDRRLPDLGRDLRRLTRALGPVREIDVTRGVLAALWPKYGWPPHVLGRVDRVCEAARSDRRREMLTRLARGDAPDLPRRLSALADAVEGGADGVRAGALLASRLRKRAKALGDAIAVVGVVYAPAPIHTVRIAAKKLRYTLEIGGTTAGLPVAVPLREFKALQELLGGLSDRQAVQHWLKVVAARPGTGRQVIRALDACQVAIEKDCRGRHARFVRRAPRLMELARLAGRDVVFGLLTYRPTRMASGARPRTAREGGRGVVES
jgi:CHAD domain-containing protein